MTRPPLHYNPPPRFGLRVPTYYGVYEVATNTWVGTEDGPTMFTNIMLAAIAHTVSCIQLGVSGTALIVAEIPNEPAWKRRTPDHTPVMSRGDALAVAQGDMDEHRARRAFALRAKPDMVEPQPDMGQS